MKDFFFPFYPKDFLTGTDDMSAAEVGAYIRLLCHQWDKGKLPDDNVKLARLAKSSKQICQRLRCKFAKTAEGFLQNPRMKILQDEREKIAAKNAENGRKGAESKWRPPSERHAVRHPKKMATGMATPMANEWRNDGHSESELKIKTKKGKGTPASAGDQPSDQTRFIGLWSAAFEKFFGTKYAFQKQDPRAAQSLVAHTTPEILMETAARAWTWSGFLGQQARTIYGFNARANEIQAEIAHPTIPQFNYRPDGKRALPGEGPGPARPMTPDEEALAAQ